MTPTEALDILLSTLPAPTHETVSLDSAPGRILLETITADRPFPAFDRVMMDGIAVKSTAIQAGSRTFELTGLATAGSPAVTLPSENACIRVNTGAVLPTGADQVIPIEEVDEINEVSATISENVAAEAFQFVHRKGSDFAQESELIQGGTVIGAKEVGVLASVGAAQVQVAQAPKITLISTGDELVDIDQTPLPHQIRRSNTTAMQAACKRLGIEAETLHLADELTPIKVALEQLFDSGSWIILSGGISKGTHDFIPTALEKLGAEQQFQWVKQRPGKPMAFYTTPSGVPIFALPGNPMSTLCCFHRYVLPALDKTLGKTSTTPAHVTLAEPFIFKKPLALFLPVRLNKEGEAIPVPTQNSGDFASIMGTDGFIELPADQDTFEAGQSFSFYPWV